MPFAGTDKIDPQISPMVQRQAAAAQGDIFIRSAGSIERQESQLAHNIPIAPTRVAGDALFVLTIGSGTYANPAGWFLHSSQISGFFKMYRRTASGDANDNFLLPDNTLSIISQMVCIGNKLGFVLGAANWAGGFSNNDASSDGSWYVSFPNPPYSPGQPLSLPVNTTQDPNSFDMLIMGGITNQPGSITPTFSGTNPDGMQVIGEDGWFSGALSNDTFWFAWYFNYEVPSRGYNSYTATHLPARFTSQHTQHTRWQIG